MSGCNVRLFNVESGKHVDCPEPAKALAHCKLIGLIGALAALTPNHRNPEKK